VRGIIRCGSCNCCSLDATCDDGSLCRLVNDENKKPNCVIKLLEADNSTHLCLFALEDINAGTELRYNYGQAITTGVSKIGHHE